MNGLFSLNNVATMQILPEKKKQTKPNPKNLAVLCAVPGTTGTRSPHAAGQIERYLNDSHLPLPLTRGGFVEFCQRWIYSHCSSLKEITVAKIGVRVGSEGAK